jgi:electron transfer flavoprotein alpha subunit
VALLDVMQISDIVKVIAARHVRAVDLCRQRRQQVRSKDKIKVITVRTATFQATVPGDRRPSRVVRHLRPIPRCPPRGRGAVEVRPAGADLRENHRLGGRAMQSRENFTKYIEPVADKLGAAVGARGRRSMPAMHPTTGRSAKPARW